MKRLAFFLSMLLFSGHIHAIPVETLERLKKLYPGQSEVFLLARINQANTPLAKWRAFAPYFYDLLKRSGKAAPTPDRLGLCAGDAHFENFGFLYRAQTTVFTLNDLDDVSHCSLNSDALRLFISHQMVTSFKTSEWLRSYSEGLAGQMSQRPEVLTELETKSLTNEDTLPKKEAKLLTEGCTGDYAAVPKADQQMLKDYLKTEGQELLVSCSHEKQTGGSAGLKRFILLYEKNQKVAGIELKPLINPAPQWERAIDVSIRKLMLENAVSTYLTNSFHHDYFAVTVNGSLYQRRPIFSGNVGVKMENFELKAIKAVALYQANLLGQKHRLTNADAFKLSPIEWDKWARMIRKLWDAEFKNK